MAKFVALREDVGSGQAVVWPAPGLVDTRLS